jgi:diacylglycerol kinase (ATP)
VPFLEGVGVGLFPRMISRHESNQRDRVCDAVDVHGGFLGGTLLLRQVLKDFHGCRFTIRLENDELDGQFLLVEVMNIPSIGPGLELARNAHPGDGYLDVVVVREDQRAELDRQLAGSFSKEHRPTFNIRRTRRVSISCAATAFHIDDELWPGPKPSRKRKPTVKDLKVEIAIFPGALRVMIPK